MGDHESEEVVTLDDLVKTDGLYYKKFTEFPFSGKVTGKKEQGSFKKGNRDGPWVTYYENGRIHSKGSYKFGKYEGLVWDPVG